MVEVFTDSDWAGCRSSRRSNRGGVVTVGGNVAKTWSSTQGSVPLSSAEAEFYALVKGAAEAIAMRSLMADLGIAGRILLRVDSNSAKAIASRRGVGKVKHMETRFLWVQEKVRRGDIVVKKIKGTINPADVLTKPKSRDEFLKLMGPLKVQAIA